MDLNSKIVEALGRISEVYKVLLWEHAKKLKLSPIQIQILNFIAYHDIDLCNVSHLAKEFNVTKPTVSDAIRVLVNKELLIKDFSSSDSRSYSLLLSKKGKDIVKETERFAEPVGKRLLSFSENDLTSLYGTLSTLIYQLNRDGILTVQRTCFGCKHYSKNGKNHHCNLLQIPLLDSDIRIDCPEYAEKL
ncbi:helix-turn-helix domain-containing protein [Aquimarina sp. AU474]|uniref:MarR family transcriptional regulator n=1 Tax=Aquimarina sp. AU474 TaxID=2108529 RepID=UPI000D69D80E|nr:MarR family transcriptional regulator [Aquimarina sp. AU474]